MCSYLGETFNERVDICGIRNFFDLIQGHHTAVITIGNVLCDATVEEHRLLRNDGYLRTEPLYI